MSQPLLPDVAPPEDQTFGDIVWLQFKKNRVAYCSLWGLAGLFALAITAPLLAISSGPGSSIGSLLPSAGLAVSHGLTQRRTALTGADSRIQANSKRVLTRLLA